MHIIYVYMYALTCSCNHNDEDFGEMERRRSKGTTSLAKRSTVKGTITIEERVEVAWGKSKKYYTVELNVSDKCCLQAFTSTV